MTSSILRLVSCLEKNEFPLKDLVGLEKESEDGGIFGLVRTAVEMAAILCRFLGEEDNSLISFGEEERDV